MNSSFFENLTLRESPLIIAELGAKYGDVNWITQTIRGAALCGADMLKFQTYRAETISVPGNYFTLEDGTNISQYDFFKKYELSEGDHDIISVLCNELDIEWTSTPSHVTDLALLERYQLPCYKTGSDDLTNLPLLKAIAEKGRPMLVSTGMCSLAEIEAAVNAVFSTGNKELVLLHCVVSYPSRIEQANLRVIETLKKAFGVPIGLSDHTTDEFTSILATQMGVALIEKHFTSDHALNLPDHEASLDPSQFKRLVDRVKLVSKALGNGVKTLQPSEEKWRNAARKSIYAAVDIPEGFTITENDVFLRRPSNGIHPHHLPIIIGRKAKGFIPKGSLINWDMI